MTQDGMQKVRLPARRAAARAESDRLKLRGNGSLAPAHLTFRVSYGEFRELVLMCVVSNIERAVTQ